MIEAKYSEIWHVDNRGTFRAVLRTEIPDGATLITAKYVLSIKSDEDKKRTIQGKIRSRWTFAYHK